MKGAIISFSQKGFLLSARVEAVLAERGYEVQRAVKCRALAHSIEEPLSEWTGRNFAVQDVLIFVGAASIAVRAIAPYLRSKAEDPAVLVMDELGKHCIPILSGHMGGANELAMFLGRCLMADPVITTATDLNEKWAVDVFAVKNQLHMEDLKKAKSISARLLAGEEILLAAEEDCTVEGEIPPEVKICTVCELKDSPDILVGVHRYPRWKDALYLVPRKVVLGMGCRKGTEVSKIREAAKHLLCQNGISERAVAAVASIDLKAGEEGLLTYCRQEGLEFQVYSAGELKQAEGIFSSSEFVARSVGVDNVCERSAVLASGGRLIAGKQARDGVTAAAAVADWRVIFE